MQTLSLQYDNAAAWWGNAMERHGYRSAYRALIEASIGDTSMQNVCDMGTGTGAFAQAFCAVTSPVNHLTLVDFSAQMLEKARDNLTLFARRLTTVHASLEQYKPTQPFDLILCAHLIEHCPDPNKAMEHLANMLAPNGTLLLVASRPHWCQWLIWLTWRHRWFSQHVVAQMGADAGLTLQTITPFTSGPPKHTSLGYFFTKPSKEPTP